MKTKAEVRSQNSGPASGVGRPVSARRIQRIRSASSLTSGALEQTNPLRGLTLARAVALMEATLRGEYAIPQWTLWHIEQTDPDLFALESRRAAALMEMDWVIKIADLKPRISGLSPDESGVASVAKPNASLAAEQAKALLEAYNQIDNLNEAIEDMALAFVHGYSIAQFEQSESARSLQPTAYSPISQLGIYDPWNIVRQNLKGDFYFNSEGRSISWQTLGLGNKIDPANHLIYTPRKNLMRIALYKFIRTNLSQKDWDAFIEIYGLPSVFIIQPPNIPTGQESAFEDAAADAAAGGSGSLPNGSDVKIATEARGVNPFRDHLKYLQEQLILAGTGGLLTMLTAPTGLGSDQGSTHEDTFKTIARGEAKKISEVFQKQFDKHILEAAFPGKPILAYFEIASKEEQDIGEIIDHALKISQAGFTMDPAELSEKTGYKISVLQRTTADAGPSPIAAKATGDTLTGIPANAGSKPPTPPAPEKRGALPPASATVSNALPAIAPPEMSGPRADPPALGRLLATARDQLAIAQDKVLGPLRARLETIMSLPDPEVEPALRRLQSELPDLLKQMNADPATAKVFEDTLSAALLSGLTTL